MYRKKLIVVLSIIFMSFSMTGISVQGEANPELLESTTGMLDVITQIATESPSTTESPNTTESKNTTESQSTTKSQRAKKKAKNGWVTKKKKEVLLQK